MKRKVFITGASSGIGKALAEAYLEKGDLVEGISRRSTITHRNYLHHTVDLAEIEKVSAFEFNKPGSCDELILINNAGWLGEVKLTGRLLGENIVRLNQINVTAPFLLINTFLKQFKGKGCALKIVNISSGAANYPIKSWSGYCASKAALDMFTRVIAEEHPEVKCLAIAPGVVDTEMQGAIRQVDQSDFEAAPKFHEYHRNGELKKPEEVAEVIVDLLENEEKIPGTVFSLRDL